MTNYAVITARGGSKRIPRKNIKNFLGQPIIKYAIEACLESQIFDEVMVSTDDYEIAEIAKKFGAKIPFMRSEKTSDDFCTTADVLNEIVQEYKKRGVKFDNLCCVYPCVPFLTSDLLKDAYNQFIEQDADSIIPVVNFSYPIQRALKIENEQLVFAQPEFINSRSQDLEKMYHDVGMFYYHKVKNMTTIGGAKTVPYLMRESEIQDIDTLEDWKMAEIKYKVLEELNQKGNSFIN